MGLLEMKIRQQNQKKTRDFFGNKWGLIYIEHLNDGRKLSGFDLGLLEPNGLTNRFTKHQNTIDPCKYVNSGSFQMYITFVYEKNKEIIREILWRDLSDIV